MIRGYVIPALVVAGLTAMTAPADPSAPVPVEAAERPADQTFLTYPEWYLVHSPEEYATFLTHSTPDAFPFLGHLGQFWGSYSAIYEHIADTYPFNAGYHMMVMVIGLSTTVEYATRAAYEAAFGRVTRMVAGDTMTAEDRYAAGAARRYVDFVNHTPFYKYPFADDLGGLWTDVPLSDEGNALRKWERRYVLTTEYGFKAFYAWLIGKMTAGAYTKPLLTTRVEIRGRPPANREGLPKLEVLEEKSGSTVMNLPRYGEFTTYAVALAQAGVAFQTIAGNDGDILTTILTPATASVASSDWMTVLFDQPLLTQPDLKRVGVVCKVADLSRLLRHFDSDLNVIEHVYDY